jgi:hypothetical protein
VRKELKEGAKYDLATGLFLLIVPFLLSWAFYEWGNRLIFSRTAVPFGVFFIGRGIWRLIKWSELPKEFKDGKPDTFFDYTNINALFCAKEARLALFIAISWTASALVYNYLFEPYGYRTDWAHLLLVIILPIGTGLALCWTYKKFVQ